MMIYLEGGGTPKTGVPETGVGENPRDLERARAAKAGIEKGGATRVE